MAILDLVLGRPLASAEDKAERVGSFAGVSVFGLDALSSAAYGPEAALTILIPLGVAGSSFSLPITIAVSSILTIVYFSYRQTIAAYPNGAGSYTVAKENLGRHAGLLGAVALLIDYTLNVAVGNLGGNRCSYFGGPVPATLYLAALPGGLGSAHLYESAGNSRIGFRLYAADLSVRRLPWTCSDHRAL